MITLLGVGHVFAISDKVKEIIRQSGPEVVCLELDLQRYQALLSKQKSATVPLQYRLLAHFQKRMADKFGTEAGDEMLAAASAAGEIGAKLALIDMDAPHVFARLWKRMTMREKLSLMVGAFTGLFLSKEKVEEEIEKYEGHEDEYLALLGEGYPSIKQVLIDDRNKFMADRLREISTKHNNVFAVIGDGHIPGLLEQLRPLEVKAIRLRDVRIGEPGIMTKAEFSSTYFYDQH